MYSRHFERSRRYELRFISPELLLFVILAIDEKEKKCRQRMNDVLSL